MTHARESFSGIDSGRTGQLPGRIKRRGKAASSSGLWSPVDSTGVRKSDRRTPKGRALLATDGAWRIEPAYFARHDILEAGC